MSSNNNNSSSPSANLNRTLSSPTTGPLPSSGSGGQDSPSTHRNRHARLKDGTIFIPANGSGGGSSSAISKYSSSSSKASSSSPSIAAATTKTTVMNIAHGLETVRIESEIVRDQNHYAYFNANNNNNNYNNNNSSRPTISIERTTSNNNNNNNMRTTGGGLASTLISRAETAALDMLNSAAQQHARSFSEPMGVDAATAALLHRRRYRVANLYTPSNNAHLRRNSFRDSIRFSFETPNPFFDDDGDDDSNSVISIASELDGGSIPPSPSLSSSPASPTLMPLDRAATTSEEAFRRQAKRFSHQDHNNNMLIKMKGYLYIHHPGSYSNLWTHKWFTLSKRHLYQFFTDKDNHPFNKISCSSIYSVSPLTTTTTATSATITTTGAATNAITNATMSYKGRNHCFEIRGLASRSLILSAESDEVMWKWINAINESIKECALDEMHSSIERVYNIMKHDKAAVTETILKSLTQRVPEWQDDKRKMALDVAHILQHMVGDFTATSAGGPHTAAVVPPLPPLPLHTPGGSGSTHALASPLSSRLDETLEHHRYEQEDEFELNPKHIKLQTLLGEGYFGQVFRGTLWGKEVAIKRLKYNNQLDDKILAKLKHEAAVMKKLRHPNILLFMGFCYQHQHQHQHSSSNGNDSNSVTTTITTQQQQAGAGVDTMVCIVTEFLTEGDLYTVLHRRLVTDRMLIQFIKDIAAGMSYLHYRHCIHLDLKPSNLLVGGDFSVKVADFGLSSYIGQELSLTGTALYPGTVLYAAEELWAGPCYSYKSDVFSFGVILFELLWMREHPTLSFQDNEDLAFDLVREPLSRVRSNDVVSIGDEDDFTFPWWHVELRRLALMCLCKDQNARPSFEEICEMLDKIPVDSEWFIMRRHARNFLQWISSASLSTSPSSFSASSATVSNPLQVLNEFNAKCPEIPATPAAVTATTTASGDPLGTIAGMAGTTTTTTAAAAAATLGTIGGVTGGAVTDGAVDVFCKIPDTEVNYYAACILIEIATRKLHYLLRIQLAQLAIQQQQQHQHRHHHLSLKATEMAATAAAVSSGVLSCVQLYKKAAMLFKQLSEKDFEGLAAVIEKELDLNQQQQQGGGGGGGCVHIPEYYFQQLLGCGAVVYRVLNAAAAHHVLPTSTPRDTTTTTAAGRRNSGGSTSTTTHTTSTAGISDTSLNALITSIKEITSTVYAKLAKQQHNTTTTTTTHT